MAGTLFVVATPIGNLSDVSRRALETLRAVALVACEDTRVSRNLLAHHGIDTRTTSLHEHNEGVAAARLIERMQHGEDIALISDAGTPGVSDPGARLVEAAHRARLKVTPIPGPSAALAAWCASGFASDRFLFAGFLPSTPTARRKALESHDSVAPVIFYEAPHRILESVADLAAHFGHDRELVIARELTKKFEEIGRMRLGEAQAWLLDGPHRQQGEFVLVVGPGDEHGKAHLQRDAASVLRVLLEALPPSDAARLAGRLTGIPRKELYALALSLAETGKGTK